MTDIQGSREQLLEEWSKTPSNGIDPATWWQRKAFELGEQLALKDDLLRAYRTGDHKLADRTLSKLAALTPAAPETPPDSNALLEVIADLINCWDVFYTFLPDGEYRGLAQMRAACNQHRKLAGTPRKEEA